MTQYFERVDWHDGHPLEDDVASTIRMRINRRGHEVERIVHRAGVSDSVSYTAAPMTGGPTGQIPVIANIFNLHRFEVSHATAIDFVDKAIGNYEYDISAAWLRTFNPFYWLGLLLEIVVRLPFQAAARAGFDTQRIEHSLFGRLAKFIGFIVVELAALLAILQVVGWLQPLLDVLGLPAGPQAP